MGAEESHEPQPGPTVSAPLRVAAADLRWCCDEAWLPFASTDEVEPLTEIVGQDDAIETLRPAAKGELELLGLHSWGADAYAGGAWAYFRPGEVTRFAAVLGRAHGRLHFCGEHLALTSRGMEGAMESAEETVAEILEAA